MGMVTASGNKESELNLCKSIMAVPVSTGSDDLSPDERQVRFDARMRRARSGCLAPQMSLRHARAGWLARTLIVTTSHLHHSDGQRMNASDSCLRMRERQIRQPQATTNQQLAYPKELS